MRLGRRTGTHAALLAGMRVTLLASAQYSGLHEDTAQ